MNILSKVIVSIIASLIVFVIFGLLAGIASSNGGHISGIIGLILLGGLFFGLKAIWKKPQNKENKNNTSILQK
jgi:membrane associated rhomboid family serine protease